MRLEEYFSKHPEIFNGLERGAVINYTIGERKFHIVVGDDIQVMEGVSREADLEVKLSEAAERKLVETPPEEYPKVFGELFLSPEGDAWVEIELVKPMEELLSKGYGEWAKRARVM